MNDIIRDDNKLFLRLQRQGSKYTASCSVDGRKFIPVGTADIMLKDVMAGMIACNGVPLSARFGNFPGMPGMQRPSEPETPFEVMFDYFHIVNRGLR
jgi:hypothetical protein